MNNFYSIMNLMERIDPQYHRYASILNEDKRGKAAKKACYNVIRQHFNNAEWLDQEYTGQNNPHHLSAIDWIYDQFMDQFYHENSYQNSAIMRLAPLFLRLALKFGFQQLTTVDEEKINRLHAIENYLHQANKTQGMDLKGINLDMSYEELNRTFGEAVDNEEVLKKQRIENSEYEDDGNYNGYEIVGPLTYEEAHEYGNYSCPGGKLCYTQGKGTWDKYTTNGMNDAYVLLRDGWEDIPAEHDDDGMDGYDGYDRYGLSMIFVFVDGEGRLAYCNTRWNHNASYKPGRSVDHALDEEDISKLIGKNFYKVFKPNDKWRKALEDAMTRLRNGEKPAQIFNYYCYYDDEKVASIELYDKYNLIDNNNEILLDQWYDNVSNVYNGLAIVEDNLKYNIFNIRTRKIISPDLWFNTIGRLSEGFVCVRLNSKWNFMDLEGKILSDMWFDGIDQFKDGYAVVMIHDRGYNLINTSGKLIFDIWFERFGKFNSDGIANVSLKGKWNFVTTGGEFISKRWFDVATPFSRGLATVAIRRNGERLFNCIDTNGNLLSKRWFDDITDFDGFGMAEVVRGDKHNLINTEGKCLLKRWVDQIGEFYQGVAKIRIGKKYNFIDKNCKLISPNRWFDHVVEDFYGESNVRVMVNGKWNLIDKHGNTLFKKWFDYLEEFRNGHAPVMVGKKWNWIDMNGNIKSKRWFDNVGWFYDGYAKVMIGGKYNFLGENDEFISDVWFNMVEDFENGCGRFKLGDKWNFLDKDGNIKSKQWFDKIEPFYVDSGGVAVVKENGKFNYINTEGKLLSPNQWFDRAESFDDYYGGIVTINGDVGRLKPNGKLHMI